MKIIKTKNREPKGPKFAFFRSVFRARIFERSATLTYYFLFSLFPTLIIISTALSLFHLDSVRIEEILTRLNFIPSQVVLLLTSYLNEISDAASVTFLFIGIVLALYSAGKAVEILKHHIRKVFHSHPERNYFAEWGLSLLFVFLMIFGFFASLVLVVAGNALIRRLTPVFHFSDSLLLFFHSFRIIIPALYVFFLLTAIYMLLPGIRMNLLDALPGSVFAMTSWVLVSWLFSFYVDNMNDYSMVYGSLGAIIVLLIWLHFICFFILFGAHLNAYIYEKKHGEFNDQLDSGVR